MKKLVILAIVLSALGATMRYLNENYDSLSAAVGDAVAAGQEASAQRHDDRIAPLFAGLTNPDQLIVSRFEELEQDIYRASRPSHVAFLDHAFDANGGWTGAAVQVMTTEKAQQVWLTDLTLHRNGDMSGEVVVTNQRYGLQLGNRYTFDKFEIRDWAMTRDGRVYGLFTARMLRDTLPPDIGAATQAVLSEEAVPADWGL